MRSARKHVPIRTCVGCGDRDRRGAMIRVVKGLPSDEAAVLLIDAAGDRAGRGAYLHNNDECWMKFARRGGTLRSLRASIPQQTRAALIDELRAGGSSRG